MFSDTYLLIVILLFVLAISDLIVGVSNDAVNFLNSAIGSKVASRNVIMVVASLGILVGATFSSGMMEVARKGVFNPEFFVFGEVMVIFIAVMLTDIILLDLFNTLGLPTSTTVSIVFELLGAAVVVAIIKLYGEGNGVFGLGDYINSSQALTIISGIFLSVVFAFAIGLMVQFISRLILSFKYQDRGKMYSWIWCGLAMTSMTYFLLFKGIKGTSFASESLISFMTNNILQMAAISFAIWLVLLMILSAFKINSYKLVVLFGTFALAMAFAGNDLVNFIGVPIAGFESYLSWSDSNQDAFAYSMDVLKEPVRTKSYLLVISGVIMITTLWFSKKARSVTETEVNLGRQSEGHERFSPNRLAQKLVQFTVGFSKYTLNILPEHWLEGSARQFEQLKISTADKPAFDLVRAGVNLTTASVLIAFATSLKLPLSTTYVSFMVAMGTSLADQAWGRDSAVYRVAGVLNVIGGWFATAIIAFMVSGFFALLIYHFNMIAIGVLLALAIFLITRSFAYHRKKEKKKNARQAFEKTEETISSEIMYGRLNSRLVDLLERIQITFDKAMTGLIKEDRKMLSQASASAVAMIEQNEDLQYELYQSIKRIEETASEGSRGLLYIFDLEQDLVQSVDLIVKVARQHVRNVLNPLKDSQITDLRRILSSVDNYLNEIMILLKEPKQIDLDKLNNLKQKSLEILEFAIGDQIQGIKGDSYGARNSQLIFKLLLEIKDLIAISARFIIIYKRSKIGNPELFISFSGKSPGD